MKTTIIGILAIVAVCGILISISAMSGNINIGIELGKENKADEVKNAESLETALATKGNGEKIEWEIQNLHQPPVKIINKEISTPNENTPVKIDIDGLHIIPNPPGIYYLETKTTSPLKDYSIPIVYPDIISGTGIIQYVTNEPFGSFYGIISDDGKHYQPSNLPPEFEVDGLPVKFEVKIAYNLMFYTWGIPVDILEIEILS